MCNMKEMKITPSSIVHNSIYSLMNRFPFTCTQSYFTCGRDEAAFQFSVCRHEVDVVAHAYTNTETINELHRVLRILLVICQ